MLRSIICCRDLELAARIHQLLENTGEVQVSKRVPGHPSPFELSNLIRVHAPEIVFLSVETMSAVLQLVKAIEEIAPGTAVVALSRTFDSTTLLPLMHAGVRDFLQFPFDSERLAQTLDRVAGQLERIPPQMPTSDLIISFLPAKGGVGASTIATNTSVALSRLPGTAALLTDFDLRCGIVRFLLKIDKPYSVADLAAEAADLDSDRWSAMVARCGKLDVLHAGRLDPSVILEGMQVQDLLSFARRNYRVVCADLSEHLESHAQMVLRESKRIFLVSTPELPSLHLARQKRTVLEKMGLQPRIRVLLNRTLRRSPISVPQVEDMLETTVHMVLPNDYGSVQHALTRGRPVGHESELGQQFELLAESILRDSAEESQKRKRSFASYFSFWPVRAAKRSVG